MRDRTARDFSRRERQIMEIIWGRGEATAAEVLAALPDPPTYSAVRSTLRILEEKGHLTHRRDGQNKSPQGPVNRPVAQVAGVPRAVLPATRPRARRPP